MAKLSRALIEERLPLSVVSALAAATVPEAELRQEAERMLAHRPDAHGAWVFAYGALMWEQEFAVDAIRPSVLDGWIRRYSLWDERDRGTPDRRGLTLGLIREAGSCAGLALHLPEEKLAEAFWAVWRHEMSAGFYDAKWIPISTPAGPVQALTFEANTRHRLYAGKLSEPEIVEALATAVGHGGAAASYLLAAIERLRDCGLSDEYLDGLGTAVARRLLHD